MQTHPGRPVGVAIPTNQRTEAGVPLTVSGVARLELVLVEYTDENGRKRPPTLALRSGSQFFPWPNGEQLTIGFKPFTDTINKQILAKLEEDTPGSTGATMVLDNSVDVSPAG